MFVCVLVLLWHTISSTVFMFVSCFLASVSLYDVWSCKLRYVCTLYLRALVELGHAVLRIDEEGVKNVQMEERGPSC